MSRTNALQTVQFSGKSLGEHHKDIRAALLEAEQNNGSPLTIDDALSICGVSDPYARAAIKRSFLVTLRPADGDHAAGDNFDLTQGKKWLANRDLKWTKDLQVPKGKNTLVFEKTTVPTTELSRRINGHNGALTDDVSAAASNIAVILATRANARLDQASIAYIAEDLGTILADNASLNRAIKIQEEANLHLKQAMDMMSDLIAKIPNQGGGNQGGAVRR